MRTLSWKKNFPIAGEWDDNAGRRFFKLVDREAIRFLAEFEAAKGRITGCPTYIREWIRSERAEG